MPPIRAACDHGLPVEPSAIAVSITVGVGRVPIAAIVAPVVVVTMVVVVRSPVVVVAMPIVVVAVPVSIVPVGIGVTMPISSTTAIGNVWASAAPQ